MLGKQTASIRSNIYVYKRNKKKNYSRIFDVYLMHVGLFLLLSYSGHGGLRVRRQYVRTEDERLILRRRDRGYCSIPGEGR